MKKLLKAIKAYKRFGIIPEWKAEYVYKDGIRKGPFMWSLEWLKIEEQARLIFGDDLGDKWRQELKNRATNKSYVPPDNHIHLANRVINHLTHERDLYKNQMIEAKKEVSKLRRSK